MTCDVWAFETWFVPAFARPLQWRLAAHRTRAVFDRYNITSDDDLRQAVKQTQEHLSAQPTLRNVVAIGKKQ